nr:nucleoid-associated protein [Moritella viscosa]SHN97570.1 Putative uncharacterized protein [Moritella viscosa]
MSVLQSVSEELVDITTEVESNIRDVAIISTVLHQIDVEHKESTLIPITSISSDLKIYLRDLLAEITVKTQKRKYAFDRPMTEFYNCLKEYFVKQELSTNAASSNLASRLLVKEIDTDERYGHLGNKNTHVKKGSFLQFLYTDYNGNTCFLGVKIEYQTFLDEADFTKKIGLSTSNKIYKAVSVTYCVEGTPDTVVVYDNNTTPAKYWWHDFLELKESRTNAKNTKEAIQAVMQLLNRYKDKHPSDHTILRNSVVAAFRQNNVMKFDDFIENTFENYTPDDEALVTKLPDIVNKLKELPDKKGFDSQFILVPSAVPYRKSKVILSDEITVELENGIANLDEKFGLKRQKMEINWLLYRRQKALRSSL